MRNFVISMIYCDTTDILFPAQMVVPLPARKNGSHAWKINNKQDKANRRKRGSLFVSIAGGKLRRDGMNSLS